MKTKTIDESYNEDINNLYRPTSKYDLETFDLVNLQECFNKNNSKFLPIVLKEWFSLLKVKGSIKIFYNPKLDDIMPLELEKTLWWLFKRNYKILSHDYGTDSAALSLIKEFSTSKKEEGIDCWTFGMVTNGVRLDFIKRSIESIRKLDVPKYEIIVCGFYPEKLDKDIKYIEFKERDDKGWITKKKNMIAQVSKYSNLCIFHDRIVFNKNWYEGMKKYGNNFEVLSCTQTLPNSARAGDWLTTGISNSNPGYMYKIEELDYKDWDRYAYISGQLVMIKKYVWEEEPWNETLYWQEGEDIEYSLRLTDRRYIPRFNPFSSCTTLSWRFGRLPKKQFSNNEKSLTFNIRDVPMRRLTRLMAYYFIKIPKANSIIKFLYPLIVNSKIYAMIKEH